MELLTLPMEIVEPIVNSYNLVVYRLSNRLSSLAFVLYYCLSLLTTFTDSCHSESGLIVLACRRGP